MKRYGQLLETEARRLGRDGRARVAVRRASNQASRPAHGVPVAPTEIIEGAIESSLTLLGSEDITIERNFTPNPPTVVGDAAALRSAIQNLIANAVKYGGSDRWVGIQVEHGRQRRRPEVWITISDHGDGIPASELPHIFDPFYRGADAVARQVHGNGLGPLPRQTNRCRPRRPRDGDDQGRGRQFVYDCLAIGRTRSAGDRRCQSVADDAFVACTQRPRTHRTRVSSNSPGRGRTRPRVDAHRSTHGRGL